MSPSLLSSRRSRAPAESDAPRRGRFPLQVLWACRFFLILGTMAVALGVIAWNILPTSVEPAAPVPPQIGIEGSSVPVSGVTYEVRPDGHARTVLITVDSNSPTLPKGQTVTLTLQGLPNKLVALPGEPRSVGMIAGQRFYDLRYEEFGGDAAFSFDVTDPTFGFQVNGVQASVALPGVSIGGGGSSNLLATYQMPHPGRYDWSSFPPDSIHPRQGISWYEPSAGQTLPSRIAVGIDHAEQSADDRNTFIAGALIGLAGAALIAAIQEALHAPFPRRHKGTDTDSATAES
jgi:hypothetical protein